MENSCIDKILTSYCELTSKVIGILNIKPPFHVKMKQLKAKANTVLFKMPFIKVRPVEDYRSESNFFTVTISKKREERGFSKYSIIDATKPFFYFISLWGYQMVRYSNNDIFKINLSSKTYCSTVIFVVILLIFLFKPSSWQYTRSDLPMNILTRTYGIIGIFEIIYAIFVISFFNSGFYVDLFKSLDNIDKHFGISRRLFYKRRIFAIILMMLPVLQTSCTFWILKFRLENIGAHFVFFLLLLQGVIIIFITLNIYTKQLMLNTLVEHKIYTILTPQKGFIFKDSIYDIIIKKILCDSEILTKKVNSHYCWFELMQIYDKISDCIYLFNRIYAGQVLIMFQSWLVLTMLSLCRTLTPTIKYSEVILSDLFMYSALSSRPIILARMSELFTEERSKTLLMLLHILVHGDANNDYISQIQTMIDLVEARKMEVSANVFTVDVSIVMNFAGRVISYTVLMIQYFYIHVFLK